MKNYMEEDHCSYRRNFCSCEKIACKNSSLKGIPHEPEKFPYSSLNTFFAP